jgi:hypothetical protein
MSFFINPHTVRSIFDSETRVPFASTSRLVPGNGLLVITHPLGIQVDHRQLGIQVDQRVSHSRDDAIPFLESVAEFDVQQDPKIVMLFIKTSDGLSMMTCTSRRGEEMFPTANVISGLTPIESMQIWFSDELGCELPEVNITSRYLFHGSTKVAVIVGSIDSRVNHQIPRNSNMAKVSFPRSETILRNISGFRKAIQPVVSSVMRAVTR